MPLSDTARADLSAQLGPGYVVVDIKKAPPTTNIGLTTVVSGQLIGILRAQFPQARILLAEIHDAGPRLDDAFEDEGMRDLLMRAVRLLPERDQVIVALYFFEGLTLAEIGRVLDVTESRVSQLRSRATRALPVELA
eukprot:gene34852-39408_t